MKRIALLCIAAIALCGCASGPSVPQEPAVQIKTVDVPVPVNCDPSAKLGPAPTYPDTDSALASVPDVFTGVKLLKAGRRLRIARLAADQQALDSCRHAPPPAGQ
jgi:hypothetical protein